MIDMSNTGVLEICRNEVYVKGGGGGGLSIIALDLLKLV